MMHHSRPLGFILLLGALQATACSQGDLFDNRLIEQPKIIQTTQAARTLAALPPAKVSTMVAVYDFQDQTGQLKPNNNFAEYSHAVTQGGLAILTKALLSAGNGSWFTVVERGGLKDLLQERQIINVMRQQYTTPQGDKLPALPPLLYAGMLIEGGIVGYDSNIVTGGAGANYLGIGGNVSHQRDIVTVDLRAINISNGQVMLSVTAEKTIYSTALQGNVFRYVSLNNLLEAETGFTTNEPPQLAVRQAIEAAVYEMIMQGARKGLWEFADERAGQVALAEYMRRLAAAGENVPLPTAPSAITPTSTSQLPSTSTPATPAPAQGVQAEKKSIFKGIKDFMSFDDENAVPANRDASTIPPYPPVPTPYQKAH